MFILFLVVILSLTNYSWSSTITPEGLQRFSEYLGEVPEDNLRVIPDDRLGIAYYWIPILIRSQSQAALNKFLSQVKYVIRPPYEPDKSRSYSELEVIKDITKDMYYDKHRFLDPKEIIDAIDALKSLPNSYFVGFMAGLDIFEITIEDKTFYIYDENRYQYDITDSWYISMDLKQPTKKDGRIFNWFIEVTVK
jgi:hypothetical protein